MITAIILFTLILLPAMIFLTEAWLEVDVISLKDPTLPDYKKLNRREHFKSAVFAILVTVPFYEISVYLQVYWACAAIFVCRRIFFEVPLRLFRNRKWYRYEGDGPVDGTCKKLFGENGAWIELLLELVITALSINSILSL